MPQAAKTPAGWRFFYGKQRLAEEIIACGDSYNDVGMIKFAGLGVAMANAPRDIQEIADVVTLSNDNDGVAQVVEKYVL